RHDRCDFEQPVNDVTCADVACQEYSVDAVEYPRHLGVEPAVGVGDDTESHRTTCGRTRSRQPVTAAPDMTRTPATRKAASAPMCWPIDPPRAGPMTLASPSSPVTAPINAPRDGAGVCASSAEDQDGWMIAKPTSAAAELSAAGS